MIAAAAEELVLASAIIIAIGSITFGMIISYRRDIRDEPGTRIDGVLKLPPDAKTSRKEARRRTSRILWKQVTAERSRNACTSSSRASRTSLER